MAKKKKREQTPATPKSKKPVAVVQIVAGLACMVATVVAIVPEVGFAGGIPIIVGGLLFILNGIRQFRGDDDED